MRMVPCSLTSPWWSLSYFNKKVEIGWSSIESCERLSVQIYAAYAIQSVLKLSNNVVFVGDHLYLYLTQLPFKLSALLQSKLG